MISVKISEKMLEEAFDKFSKAYSSLDRYNKTQKEFVYNYGKLLEKQIRKFHNTRVDILSKVVVQLEKLERM